MEFLRDEERVEPVRLTVVLLGRKLKIPVGRMDELDPFDFPRNRIDAVSLLSAFRCAHAQSCRNTLICPV